MDVPAQFRRRVEKLILAKYRSLDRFYLETGFSKGHASEILRGKGRPSLNTIVKLAKALEVDVCELFVFPDRSERDALLEQLLKTKTDRIRRILEELERKH
jgi:transcriptional regulator with XRE-family HTH domain